MSTVIADLTHQAMAVGAYGAHHQCHFGRIKQAWMVLCESTPLPGQAFSQRPRAYKWFILGLISRQGLESSFLIISVLVHSSAYDPRKSSLEEVGSSSSFSPRAQDLASDNQSPSLRREPQPSPRIWSSQMNSWPQDSMFNCNCESWTLK